MNSSVSGYFHSHFEIHPDCSFLLRVSVHACAHTHVRVTESGCVAQVGTTLSYTVSLLPPSWMIGMCLHPNFSTLFLLTKYTEICFLIPFFFKQQGGISSWDYNENRNYEHR